MLFVAYLYFILWFPMLSRAQTTTADFSSRSLDSLLQDYAFRALSRRPKTGIPFDGDLPFNFTGIKVSALRLRSGSLRRRGFNSYKEFHIPIGVFEQPYVERIVLVYQDLGNWSSLYYPLPGYRYLAPILGVLAYDAVDLSVTNLQELDIRASQNPISINFLNVEQAPHGFSPKCISFGLDGSMEFDQVINQTLCLTTKQGHFSIVAEFTAPAPTPAMAPAGVEGGGGNKNNKKGNGKSKMLWVIIGSVVGGVMVVVLLGVVFGCIVKCRRRKVFRRMETAAERGEPLIMKNVGYSKAPVAMETRTRPSLENDYLP